MFAHEIVYHHIIFLYFIWCGKILALSKGGDNWGFVPYFGHINIIIIVIVIVLCEYQHCFGLRRRSRAKYGFGNGIGVVSKGGHAVLLRFGKQGHAFPDPYFFFALCLYLGEEEVQG